MSYNVGDIIRCIDNLYNSDITIGKEYAVVGIDADDDDMPIQVLDDCGDKWWLHGREFSFVSSPSNELTELRAWKESALARFPVLALSSDEVEAKRLVDEYSHEYGDSLRDAFLEAFAWARANPV